jgi:hypothetical protein
MQREQLAFLQTVRSIKATVTGVGDRTVKLDRGDELPADYLVCATGYDRRGYLPELVVESADGGARPHALADRPAFYAGMIDPDIPEVSMLSTTLLYPQQLLGFSLGAHWLARFHAGTLAVPPTFDEMRRTVAADAVTFGPWCSSDYQSSGLPYAHQRPVDMLPSLFAQLGLGPWLAHTLLLAGGDERWFAAVCDRVQRGLGRNPATTKRST